mmetsp:Transcript_113571/g.366945  ORF Transcript_113571/g.366945 Transcript_113571/m.366945 type:complete len:244 (-) Transcript_113571:654-1385(-)
MLVLALGDDALQAHWPQPWQLRLQRRRGQRAPGAREGEAGAGARDLPEGRLPDLRHAARLPDQAQLVAREGHAAIAACRGEPRVLERLRGRGAAARLEVEQPPQQVQHLAGGLRQGLHGEGLGQQLLGRLAALAQLLDLGVLDGRVAREDGEEDDAHGPDVHGGQEGSLGPGAHHLGRHEHEGAADAAVPLRAGPCGEAKVQQHELRARLLSAELEVGELDVTVEEADDVVDVRQGCEHLPQD